MEWSDWEDTLAGLKSYHFEIFRLKPAGGDLIHGDKVNDAIKSEVSTDVSQVPCFFFFFFFCLFIFTFSYKVCT